MRLHLHEYGDPAGSALVCLHGLTGHGARFARLAALLPGRRVLAPDLRGHGRSGWDPPWSIEQHVDDVLETVEPARPDWLGFSFGGRIATAVADAAPERIRRLVLLDPSLGLPPELCREHAEAARDETVTFGSHEEAVEDALGSGLLHSAPRELLEEEAREHLVLRPDGRFEERYSRAMEVATWSELARPPAPVAAMPTLVVTGSKSWIPFDTSRYPEAEHVTVDAGHRVLLDALEPTARAVARFLARPRACARD